MPRTKVPVTVIDPLGNAVSGAAVRVTLRSTGAIVPLYVDETNPTQVSNPAITGANGKVDAWVDTGTYNAGVTGTSFGDYTEPFESVTAATQPLTFLEYPATPAAAAAVDGNEFVYKVPSTGACWRFLYNSTSPSAYKWEFVGGSPSMIENTGGGAWSTTTFTTLPGGATVYVPFEGDYIMEWGVTGQQSVTSNVMTKPWYSSAAQSYLTFGYFMNIVAPGSSDVRGKETRYGVPGDITVSISGRITTGVFTSQNSWFYLTPVRVA